MMLRPVRGDFDVETERIYHLHIPKAYVQQIRRAGLDDHERHVESPITMVAGIGVGTCGLHPPRVGETGAARIDGIQLTNMEATEDAAGHLRRDMFARGVRGYSATVLQTCRARSDGFLGRQPRTATGTGGFLIGA